MTIFRIDLCHSYVKIHSKTHKIAPFEKKYQGSMPPNPPNKHVTHTTRPNSKKFGSSPLANPILEFLRKALKKDSHLRNFTL